MKRYFTIVISIGILFTSTVARALPLSMFGGIGTTGVYTGIQYRESPYFTTQAQISGLALDPGFSSGGENYNLGLRLLNGLISEQWYPWNHGFYFTAGVFINGNRFSLQPSMSNSGNYLYATPAKVTFNPIDPYFGVGYSQRFSNQSQWSFNLSAGVAYQGSPKVNVTSGSGMYAQYAYAAEKYNLQQSFDGFKWYPVIQAGIVYHFS